MSGIELPVDGRHAHQLVPHPTPGTAVERFGNEAIAWAPHSATPAHLEPIATIVWDLLDGATSVGDIANDVAAELGLPPTIVTNQAMRVAGQLDAAGLIVADATESIAPAAGTTAPLLVDQPLNH
jgi:hypothetical protein